MSRLRTWLAVVALCLTPTALAAQGGTLSENVDAMDVRIGSKLFTESVVLGEIIGHIAREAGANPIHHEGLGGTRVLWNALLAGEIDVYAEYTSTLSREILADENLSYESEIRESLARRGILMTQPLGFNNTYAIGMREERAAELNITAMSDLRDFAELKFGFGNEFMDRADGWPNLRDVYRLPQLDVTGLDHDLAYRGLQSGAIDAIDVYTTDAEISYYGLRLLEDDLGVFPFYFAVIIYRADFAQRLPEVVAGLIELEGQIDEVSMSGMNARVKIDGAAEAQVAADFVRDLFGIVAQTETETWYGRLWRNTMDHLLLVAISLSAALVISVPLGIFAARQQRIGQIILGVVGIIQTIPSLALFVFMIPLLGIGGPPAIMALFLYSLLPIVRNTYTGLQEISPDIKESAAAIGLTSRAQLWLVELPIAGRNILAGIKTSAVINVGTATLGALIGAGGYGQPILTGIRLDNVSLILQGAIPAAALALLVQGFFEIAERVVVPKGLRIKAGA